MTDSTIPGTTDRDLTERVRRLARYGAGWDGYTAAPAGPAAVEEACAFAAALGAAGSGFEAVLEPDGTVGLATDTPGGRYVFAFAGDGAFDVMLRADGRWSDAGRHPLRESGSVTVPETVRSLVAA